MALGSKIARAQVHSVGDAAVVLFQPLRRQGIIGARFYVEEMVPAGTEVLFGVVSRPPFGNLALLGAGGTKAELFGNVARPSSPPFRSIDTPPRVAPIEPVAGVITSSDSDQLK